MDKIVETAIALNLIYDIIDRIKGRHGVVITPENIAQYVADRKRLREELNVQLGVTD